MPQWFLNGSVILRGSLKLETRKPATRRAANLLSCVNMQDIKP